MRALVFLILSFLTCVFAFSTQTEYEPLQEFSVDRERITVSGISAGAAFATQVGIGYILQNGTKQRKLMIPVSRRIQLGD